MEPIWEHMHEEAADELEGRQAHDLHAVPALALGASGDMPAERLRTAGFNRRHHLELRQAQMPRIGPPISRALGAKDVRNFQPRARHRPCRSLRPSGPQLRQQLIGAVGVADQFGRHMGILRRRAQLCMSQQNLNRAMREFG